MWQADGDANCRLCDESATSVNPVQDKSINRIEAHRANTRTNTAAGAVSRRGEAVGSGGAGVDSDAAFGSNFKKKFDMHAEESPFLECLSRCDPTSYPRSKEPSHAQFDSFDDRDIGIRGVNGSDTLNAFEGLQARAHRGQNDVAERAMHEQL